MLGKKIVVKTHHIILTNYFKQDDLNSRQARWNAFLSEFYIDMQHVKGKENIVVDALSRKLHGVYELYYNKVECRFLEKIKEKADKDPEYKFMWQQEKEFNDQGKSVHYEINKDGLLIFKKKILIPNRMELKALILHEYHRSNYSRHPGYQKMLTAIRKNYCWLGM